MMGLELGQPPEQGVMVFPIASIWKHLFQLLVLPSPSYSFTIASSPCRSLDVRCAAAGSR